MSLSDSAGLQDVEWRPLVPEDSRQVQDLAEMPSMPDAEPDADLGPKTAEDSFQFLYGMPEGTEARFEFIPLYGQPMPVEESVEQAQAEGIDEEETAEEAPEEIRKRAYEEGFAQGEKAGFETGKQNADPIIGKVQDLLHEVDELWHHLVEKYEEKMIELIGRISEKVVHAHAAVDHDTVKRVIRDAFRMVPETAEVTIDIHPQDAEQIEAIRETFFDQIKTLKHISLTPDPSVSPGGCRIKTRFGEVDATLESRLETIRQSIMNVYKNKGEHGDDA